MPLRWNPATFRYEASGVEDLAAGGVDRSAFAGTIMPMMGAPEQFMAGAAGALPRFYDNPYTQRAVGNVYEPLYGQYLAGYGGFTGAEPTQSFAEFAGTALGGGGLPSIEAYTPTNWGDILNVARARGLGYTGAQPSAELEARWLPALSNEAQARALTGLATYDPAAGSIYGGMRERGLGRLEQRFMAGDIQGPGGQALGGPAATTSDWLAYITDPTRNIVKAPYQYGYTPPAVG